MTEEAKKNQRKTRNFLLEPNIQLRYGLYFSVLSVVFATVLGSVLYYKMRDVLELVIELTDVPAVTWELVETRLQSFFQLSMAILVGFAALCFAVGVYYTHRLVGPMVAFKRHVRSIREGDLNHRTQLRESDNFVSFAEELNALSDHLSSK